MNSKMAGCICQLLLSAVLAMGQGPSKHADTITLACMELKLGQTKDAVLTRLADCADLKKFGTGDDWSVESKSVSHEQYGQVSFSDGKLIFVAKNWSYEQGDDFTFVQALEGALSAFEKEGRNSCNISTEITRNPGAEMRSVTFFCGTKLLVVQTTEIFSGANKGKSTNMTELLKY